MNLTKGVLLSTLAAGRLFACGFTDIEHSSAREAQKLIQHLDGWSTKTIQRIEELKKAVERRKEAGRQISRYSAQLRALEERNNALLRQIAAVASRGADIGGVAADALLQRAQTNRGGQ